MDAIGNKLHYVSEIHPGKIKSSKKLKRRIKIGNQIFAYHRWILLDCLIFQTFFNRVRYVCVGVRGGGVGSDWVNKTSASPCKYISDGTWRRITLCKGISASVDTHTSVYKRISSRGAVPPPPSLLYFLHRNIVGGGSTKELGGSRSLRRSSICALRFDTFRSNSFLTRSSQEIHKTIHMRSLKRRIEIT